MAILQSLYAICHYNSNFENGGISFLKTYKEEQITYKEQKITFETNIYEKETLTCEGLLIYEEPLEEELIHYTMNSIHKGFEIFSDLEEAKKTYFNYLNYLIGKNPNAPFENYAPFYKVVELTTPSGELTTPSGFKPFFDSYDEFCMRSVCGHEEFEKFFVINENNFKCHLSDIIKMAEEFKTDEEFYNFKFQSLTQYRDIKEHTYPNDSIYYSFRMTIDYNWTDFSFIQVNKNTCREYKVPCGREMINGMYRVLN